jgi:Tol biopolymer transport system component
LPSRARISRDGKFGAMTTFVNGDSYNPGNFSTRTSIVDLHTGDTIANVEDFRVYRDGEVFKRRNFNFWGVTFAHDDDRFYATLGSGKETYLVRGSIKARTFHVLTTHLECPSLSPDETRIAFKQSLDSHGAWRIYVLDLKTMKRWPLAETKSVDDQVEWLGNNRILYWRDTGIWVVNADGSGRPALFVRQASSPSVIRAA